MIPVVKAFVLAGLVSLASASPALAHGVQGQAQTPIPIAAFFWAAGGVLIVSFAGLALGWSKARLAHVPWRPAPAWLDSIARSTGLTWFVRSLVLVIFGFLWAAGAFGSTELNDNVAPVAIFVAWWVGLVPLSVALGPVWREVNPWNTLARLARLPADRPDRPPPRRLGLWPAVFLLTAWGWIELVYPTPADPRLIAAFIFSYTVWTLAGMWRYGRETWLDQGEVFSVYTTILATLSPVEVRTLGDGSRRLGFRPPVLGVTRMRWRPAQVAFIGALIATVTFDGLSGSEFWTTRDVAAAERLINLGIDPFWSGIAVATIGLLCTFAVIVGLFELAASIAGRTGRFEGIAVGVRSAGTFAHSLIPIALAYFVAHYFTLFVFQSQDLIRLASDPFGSGANLFGTADFQIDFQLVSANVIWGVQVSAIVLGHVVGLALAHDRALELNGNRQRLAARSQWAMLVLMVGLTVSGLWSLSQGMATV